MKRLVFFALALCVLTVCVWLPVGAEEMLPEVSGSGTVTENVTEEAADTRPRWQVLLEEEILPIVAVVVAGAGSVYVMILPVLGAMLGAIKKVRGATTLFAGATDGVLKASENSSATDKRVAACELALKQYELALAAEKEAREQASAEAEERFGRLLEVFATVFATSEELVRSGAAREMMKAVEQYVGKEA